MERKGSAKQTPAVTVNCSGNVSEKGVCFSAVDYRTRRLCVISSTYTRSRADCCTVGFNIFYKVFLSPAVIESVHVRIIRKVK